MIAHTDNALAAILRDAVPDLYRMGGDRLVDPISDAADRLEWRPLFQAPRDGSELLLATIPHPQERDDVRFVIGRWHRPAPGSPLSAHQARAFNRAGGFWAFTGPRGNLITRHIIAWRCMPSFNEMPGAAAQPLGGAGLDRARTSPPLRVRSDQHGDRA